MNRKKFENKDCEVSRKSLKMQTAEQEKITYVQSFDRRR